MTVRHTVGRLPVSEVWGIASRLERRLTAMGISSIADLASADPPQIRKSFNVVVMRIALELRGIPAISAEEDRTGPAWQMKRNMLTARATTHWDELAIAHAV